MIGVLLGERRAAGVYGLGGGEGWGGGGWKVKIVVTFRWKFRKVGVAESCGIHCDFEVSLL